MRWIENCSGIRRFTDSSLSFILGVWPLLIGPLVGGNVWMGVFRTAIGHDSLYCRYSGCYSIAIGSAIGLAVSLAIALSLS